MRYSRQMTRDVHTPLLDSVGAGHLAEATLDTMSTGEARRVLIARALVHKPKALVLDEPTRGLDLVARHHFMERVRGVAERGTTIILVTHHAVLMPPLTSGVAGHPDLLIADGSHPNAEGYTIIVRNILEVIEPYLKRAGL